MKIGRQKPDKISNNFGWLFAGKDVFNGFKTLNLVEKLYSADGWRCLTFHGIQHAGSRFATLREITGNECLADWPLRWSNHVCGNGGTALFRPVITLF